MRKFLVFFLSLVLASSGILLAAADYGESSDSLGQFTDEYVNLDYVSVIDDVVRNATYNAMELNWIGGAEAIYNLTHLREHDFYGGAFNIIVSYGIVDNDELSMYSTGGVSLGRGYFFLVLDSVWLDDNYVRFRWYPDASDLGVGYRQQHIEVWDGDYDRSNNTEFPAGAEILTKGNGRLYQFQNDLAVKNWYIEDHQIDTSGGTEGNVTIIFKIHDAWGGISIGLKMDWIEINTGAGGTGNLITINFNNSSPITMENAGTEGDYGFALSPELPFSPEGYAAEGYFTTQDYLDEANGSVLVQLTNATIPDGTGITVEFSSDNSTWVDNEGNAGSNIVKDGFLALDLRDLNWSSSYYLRYNFSGTSLLTPRLYQSRLITTEGEEAPPSNGITESDFPWLAIAIILMCVAYLLTRSK